MGYSAMKQDPESVFEESELCEALRPAYESDTENGMFICAFSFHYLVQWRERAAHECNLHVLIIVFFPPILQTCLSQHSKSLGRCRNLGASLPFILFT